ncbi:hypothetical protein ACOMHN_010835 [Nucella lapillus]
MMCDALSLFLWLWIGMMCDALSLSLWLWIGMMCEILKITLMKHKSRQLGIKLVGKRNGPGVYILTLVSKLLVS